MKDIIFIIFSLFIAYMMSIAAYFLGIETSELILYCLPFYFAGISIFHFKKHKNAVSHSPEARVTKAWFFVTVVFSIMALLSLV